MNSQIRNKIVRSHLNAQNRVNDQVMACVCHKSWDQICLKGAIDDDSRFGPAGGITELIRDELRRNYE